MQENKKLSDMISQEFERHMIDCNDSKKAHFDLADYFSKKAKIIKIVQGVGLSVILAWLLSTQYEGLITPTHYIVKITPIIIAVVVSIITILEPILKYHESTLIHQEYAKKYHTLWRSCKCWETDFHSDDQVAEAKIAVQKYRDQLNDINREAPHLSSLLWKKINNVRKRSEYKDVSKYSNEDNG